MYPDVNITHSRAILLTRKKNMRVLKGAYCVRVYKPWILFELVGDRDIREGHWIQGSTFVRWWYRRRWLFRLLLLLLVLLRVLRQLFGAADLIVWCFRQRDHDLSGYCRRIFWLGLVQLVLLLVLLLFNWAVRWILTDIDRDYNFGRRRFFSHWWSL